MVLDSRLQEALDAWDQGRASVSEVRSLAADLGNEHFTSGIPALFRLLDHQDEIVRYNAANSLGFDFQYRGASHKLLRMLGQDNDADCRRVAAGAIGNLFQSTKERGVLDALAKAALNDADEYVRASAYKALEIVNGVSRDEHLRLLRSQDLGVDRARVKAILAQIAG